MLDFLADKALTAIKTDSNGSWVADKKHELEGASRLDVLRWICGSLDAHNKALVCAALKITTDDLDATRRVLRAI